MSIASAWPCSVLLIALTGCGTRTALDEPHALARDGGARDGGVRDASTDAFVRDAGTDAFVGDAGVRDSGGDAGARCGPTSCAELPPDDCASSRAVRRHTAFAGCDGDRCTYTSVVEPCPDSAPCVDGICSECGCPRGTVCCNPLTCVTGGPRICVPDPEPCLEPVAAIGCDGRTYGSACAAVGMGICVSTCDVAPSRAMTATCFPSAPGRLTVLRDRASFDAFWDECPIPSGAPDFRTSDVVVACYECGCAGTVSIDRIRNCGTHATVDFTYPYLCTECDACRILCAVHEVPNLPEHMLFTFRLEECGGSCCGP